MGINNISYIEIKNCICDEVSIRESTSNIDLTNSKQSWQIDTILLAQFLSNLEAGNVSLGGLTIDKWKIKKRRVDSTNIQGLATLTLGVNENFSYIDTAIKPQILYEYQVLPMSGDIEGQPVTIQTSISFDYWWLSDATGTTNESYPFFAGINAGLQVSDISVNKQRFVYDDTFNKYPIVSYGEQEYKSGTITAALIDIFMEVSVGYRNSVLKFINNGLPKILRNPDGDIWKVDTYTCAYNRLQELKEPVSTISFSFMEVGKVDE